VRHTVAAIGNVLIAVVVGCASPGTAPSIAPANISYPPITSALESSESRDRIAWLKRHASPLRSIDPADEDFADLAPLGRAVGDARVVFLGEASHGEGSTILGNTRIVEFLHQKLGFDVVVWESGFYEGPKVWDALRGDGDPVTALGTGMLLAWSWTGEIEPLARYLATRSHTRRPLYYAGFDPQLSARASIASRARELRTLLDTLGLQARFGADSFFWRGLQWSPLTKDSLASDSLAVERFALTATQLGAEIVARSNTQSTRFWRQVLESAAANARAERQSRIEIAAKGIVSWGSSNIRDEQGARNILWLLTDRYRGHKLIVWSATIHAVRNVASVDTRDSSWNYKGYQSTGDHVWRALGSRSYVIGFVGLTGAGRLGNDIWQIKQLQHPAAELEELLGAAGFERAFLDFRHVPRGGEWLREPMLSRPIAEHAKIARWNEVIDGMVFLREMKPATWPDFDARLRSLAPGR
jgi:erythromycin esterase